MQQSDDIGIPAEGVAAVRKKIDPVLPEPGIERVQVMATGRIGHLTHQVAGRGAAGRSTASHGDATPRAHAAAPIPLSSRTAPWAHTTHSAPGVHITPARPDVS